MKLLRRRKSPSPAQRGYKIFRLALRGLVAQRVARKAFKGYKFARRLPLLIGIGAIGYLLLRTLRGSGTQATPSDTWSAPPVTPPAPIQTSGSGNATRATAASAAEETAPAAPDVPEVEGDGAPDPDLSASAAATDAGTTDGGSKAVDDDK